MRELLCRQRTVAPNKFAYLIKKHSSFGLAELKKTFPKKFFAELFFKKATRSPRSPVPHASPRLSRSLKLFEADEEAAFFGVEAAEAAAFIDVDRGIGKVFCNQLAEGNGGGRAGRVPDMDLAAV